MTKILRNPYSELFSDPSPVEAEAHYKKLMISDELETLMGERGVSRSELAKLMGVSPSRVTSMLSGSNNFTTETLVRAGRALGAELHQCFTPIGKRVRWTWFEDADVHSAFLSSGAVHIERLDNPFTLDIDADDDESKAA